jgi:hypothetical protein
LSIHPDDCTGIKKFVFDPFLVTIKNRHLYRESITCPSIEKLVNSVSILFLISLAVKNMDELIFVFCKQFNV